MPLFEFNCQECGRRFEMLVTADRKAVCPECRSTDVEKLFSSFASRSSGSKGVTTSPFT